MMRSVWICIFAFSLTVLILLGLFTVFMWVLGNVASELGDAILNQTENGNSTSEGKTFGEFLIGTVGTPVFYVYIVDITVFIASIVAMITTRKR